MRSGDSMLHHQVFREALRRFDACSLARWTENRQRPRLEHVHDASLERAFGSDYGKIDALFLGERSELLHIVGGDGDAPRERADAGITRRDDDLGVRIVAAELPGERVFAPASA